VLTCAHVVDSADDDAEAGLPRRVGRRKVVMFASGRTFLAECVSVVESAAGDRDVAVMLLGPEIVVADTSSGGRASASSASFSAPSSSSSSLSLTALAKPLPPAAAVAATAAVRGDRLFCVGNPARPTEADAKATWNTSAGACEGYMAPAACRALAKQSGLGLAPTRGERLAVSGAGTTVGTEPREGSFLLHTCWTYWGHSGAPLFDAATGEVCGLHCAWNEHTGLRHGQKGQLLHEALRAATDKAPRPLRASSSNGRKQQPASIT
jgi:hypothetical protein